jgi:hypothetical protein
VVSCRQLKEQGYLPVASPDTKEASRAAANEWLADQLQLEPAPEPSLLERKISWARTHKPEIVEALQECEADGFDPTAEAALAAIGALGGLDHLDADDLNGLLGEKKVWRDRFAREKSADPERSLKHWYDAYLARRAEDAVAKVISASEYDVARMCLDDFKAWYGERRAIDDLTAETWEAWYRHVRAGSLASETKKKRIRHARSFIVWLVERGAIPNFPSLVTLKTRFVNDRKELEPPDPKAIRKVIERASGKLKAILMVMANTGMAQVDVSALRRDQYRDGRIVRSRSKTAKKNTRTVEWKLWPETVELLDRLAETSGDRLLLTDRGDTWTHDEFVNGKRSRTDNVASVYRHLKAPMTLKAFRFFGGSSIRRQFGNHVADHFLGHGQDPVERAYFARYQDELDQAVDWLRGKLGFGVKPTGGDASDDEKDGEKKNG